MDYVRQYRLDSPSLDEEIFKFIKNHDAKSDISTLRDRKLGIFLDEDFVDPLSYLNPLIDIMWSSVCFTATSDVLSIEYEFEGRMIKNFMQTSIHSFYNVYDFKNFFSDSDHRYRKKEKLSIVPYKILPVIARTIYLRYAVFDFENKYSKDKHKVLYL